MTLKLHPVIDYSSLVAGITAPAWIHYLSELNVILGTISGGLAAFFFVRRFIRWLKTRND